MEGNILSRQSLLPAEFQTTDQDMRANHLLRKFEQYSPKESYSRQRKRMKICNKNRDFCNGATFDVIDYSDPFSIPNLLESLSTGKFGSVTKDVEDLCARRMARMPYTAGRSSHYSQSLCSVPPSKDHTSYDRMTGRWKVASVLTGWRNINTASQDIIDLDEDCAANDAFPSIDNCKQPVSLAVEEMHQPCPRKTGGMDGKSPIMLDSDEDDSLIPTRHASHPSIQYQEVILKKTVVEKPTPKSIGVVSVKKKVKKEKDQSRDDEAPMEKRKVKKEKDQSRDDETPMEKEDEQAGRNASYVGLPDELLKMETYHKSDIENDGLEDMWREMTLALECSKSTVSDSSIVEHRSGEEECSHSFLLKEDLGYVCRICGVIQKSIETIFDFTWKKGTKSTRTYANESRNAKDTDPTEITPFSGLESEHDLSGVEISLHPRHMKQMKAHQLEGFNFLVRNLVADKPGGCILAHAPGSGKTFMIISFIQSFLAKYPHARPLVVLPKGILPTWKKEFQRWQVEDIPLYDFYSSKADNRTQQLEVLNSWVENKSILFLGYKQFSNIVCGNAISKTEAACQERLLKVPSLLILDEGHTPRNENTDILHSLAKVQTPRKVVLSGTLFQNHVKEVFNILNLVRPKFLKLDSSRAIVKRVLSRVNISGGSRRHFKTCVDAPFYDLVEDTLQNDENFKRKVSVIQDLRELTQQVLHYYKGDFLEELPGLVDFTVLLNLSPKQRDAVDGLSNFDYKFKRSCLGSAVYMHPDLKEISDNSEGDKASTLSDEKIDKVLEKLDTGDGVKTKFFLNILGLSESAGEKVLVFSQYLLPLKFLEKLTIKMKGWSPGKEIFMISGDSSAEHREWSMERFNNSSDAKVFFGSIKACGEGISLVGASRILILDVHLNPSVSRQAIGRAFRPGQGKKVYTYRLVASDSPEEEDHKTSFRKELISKMWFEWNQYCGYHDFEMDSIDVKSCEDLFLESPLLGEDVRALYRR